jgi:hypothetical protein
VPYISQDDRKTLEPSLKELIETLNLVTGGYGSNNGIVVYVIYRIVKAFYGEGNFEIRSNALKVLEAAKLEYYRRVMAPYEDTKIKENGDI